MSNPGDWLYDTSANKFNNTYFRDYYGVNNGIAVDISGDLVVRGTIRNDDTNAVDMSGDLVVRGTIGIPGDIQTIPTNSQMTIFDPTGTSEAGIQFLRYWDGSNSYRGTAIWNEYRGSNYNDYFHIGISSHNGGRDDPKNNSKLTISGWTGNVGIGTTDPYDHLHLNGTEVSARLRFSSTDNSYRQVQIYNSTDGLVFRMPHDSANEHWRTAGKIQATSRDTEYVMNFTGQHRTFVENILHTDASNNEGLIVCADKNTYVSMSSEIKKGNKAITQNETLPLVSLCTKSKDKSCFGVISEAEDPEQRADRFGNFVTPYEKEEGDTRIYINSLGEGAIWVSNKNGPLESGDYITTSDIPGYGEKQDSEFLANYTVAKITMDCDFNPQLQPKEIILKEAVVDDSGNTVYNNVLDANGEIQWTPELDSDGNVVQEYPYNLRYLDLQGARLTKAEYDTKLANGEQVHIAAYVGCTYHCG